MIWYFDIIRCYITKKKHLNLLWHGFAPRGDVSPGRASSKGGSKAPASPSPSLQRPASLRPDGTAIVAKASPGSFFGPTFLATFFCDKLDELKLHVVSWRISECKKKTHLKLLANWCFLGWKASPAFQKAASDTSSSMNHSPHSLWSLNKNVSTWGRLD